MIRPTFRATAAVAAFTGGERKDTAQGSSRVNIVGMNGYSDRRRLWGRK
jgi:hypothetical protein